MRFQFASAIIAFFVLCCLGYIEGYHHSSATLRVLEGQLQIEYIDYFDKLHLEVGFYLQPLNETRYWVKLRPQLGLRQFKELRNGDFIRIVATEFTNDRQLLVHHIQKG
jgi:hypothetical protein